MSNNPYYDDPADEEWFGDEWDIEVVDAPDGSKEWEVRAHPYSGADLDDITECHFDNGYWASLALQASDPTNAGGEI